MKAPLHIYISLLFFMYSCYTQKKNLKEGIDFDKKVQASSISLFGPFKYIPSNNDRNSIELYFKQDSLKYISPGGRNYSKIYKVLFLSDSVNMISNEFQTRYFSIDTLLFYPNILFWKTVAYDIEPGKGQTATPLHSRFEQYYFKANELRRSRRTYNVPPAIPEPQSISNWARITIMKGPLGSAVDSSHISQQFQDRQEAMRNFFKSYIR
jgi:hypothetical protein